MVRREATAEASLAAMRERIKFGIAMAAMIKMIATTISNSISEKPFCFFISSPRYDKRARGRSLRVQRQYQTRNGLRSERQISPICLCFKEIAGRSEN